MVLDDVLIDLHGNPIVDDVAKVSNGGVEAELTLRAAAVHSLMMSFPDEQSLTQEEKFKRADLGMRLWNREPFQLKPEEITLIKKLISKLYGNLVTYHAIKMLDEAASVSAAPQRAPDRKTLRGV